MKIFVCIKRVPHTATKLRLAPDETGSPSRSIQTQGVEFTMSPYDEIALAEAVRLKEEAGSGEIVAVSVGDDSSLVILRTALAMGADSAIHVRAETPTGLELDGFQISTALAGLLREKSFDLICFGRLAVDDQSSQVGTMTARLLGVPSVADVIKVEAAEGSLRLHHTVEGKVEVVECKLPAVMTAQKGLAEPRYPAIKQILMAKKKPCETIEAEVPESALETISLEPPPARSPGRIVGEGAAAVPELLRLLTEEAKVI